MSIITTKETLYIGDIAITSRKLDGYINATQLCQAGNRKFDTYYSRKKTKDFLEELYMQTQNCVTTFIKFEQKTSRDKMTCVHPQVGINIVQWVSPKFDLLVSKWVYELMLFGDVKLGQERANFHNSLTTKDGLQSGCKKCRANKRQK